MEFKSIYVHALRDNNPALLRDLVRNGQLEAHLQAKSAEAHELLNQLLASEPKGPDGLPKDQQAQRLAEERVLAEMLEFPEETPSEENQEPTDDPSWEQAGALIPLREIQIAKRKLERSEKRLASLSRLALDPSVPPEKRRLLRALARQQRAAVQLSKKALRYRIRQAQGP